MKSNNLCLVKLRKPRNILSIVIKGTIYNGFSSYFLSIDIVRYNTLCGASFLPTPRALKNRLALVNINNHKQECFLWSI